LENLNTLFGMRFASWDALKKAVLALEKDLGERSFVVYQKLDSKNIYTLICSNNRWKKSKKDLERLRAVCMKDKLEWPPHECTFKVRAKKESGGDGVDEFIVTEVAPHSCPSNSHCYRKRRAAAKTVLNGIYGDGEASEMVKGKKAKRIVYDGKAQMLNVTQDQAYRLLKDLEKNDEMVR
jgi:hypothetical protein